MKKIILFIAICISIQIVAQLPSVRFKDGLKIYLNDDSTRYLQGTGLAQVWVRYNDNNPGSTIYGTPKKETFDVGLRRVRYQIMGQVTKKVFFYTQFGINSFNSLSARKPGLFLHDVTAEYKLYKNYFTVGAGLNGWNGTRTVPQCSCRCLLAAKRFGMARSEFGNSGKIMSAPAAA
jgi:hypothetical protein